MDDQKNRILVADTPSLFDAFWDSPKLHIHDDARRISCSVFLVCETMLPKAYYFLLSLAADRNIINNISDTGFVRSCRFAFLVQVSSLPSGI